MGHTRLLQKCWSWRPRSACQTGCCFSLTMEDCFGPINSSNNFRKLQRPNALPRDSQVALSLPLIYFSELCAAPPLSLFLLLLRCLCGASFSSLSKVDKIMPEDANLDANREQLPQAAMMCDRSAEAGQGYMSLTPNHTSGR